MLPGTQELLSLEIMSAEQNKIKPEQLGTCSPCCIVTYWITLESHLGHPGKLSTVLAVISNTLFQPLQPLRNAAGVKDLMLFHISDVSAKWPSSLNNLSPRCIIFLPFFFFFLLAFYCRWEGKWLLVLKKTYGASFPSIN